MLPSFDLHVLGTPPAFILSQDRTLNVAIIEAGLAADLCDLFYFCDKTNPVSLSYVSSYKEIDVLLVYVLVIPFSFQRAIVSVRFFWRVKDSIILPIAVSTIFLVFFKKALS